VWDDDALVTRNPLIADPHGLARYWFTTQASDYWPLTSTSFWLEWRLWGPHPAGFHLTNVVLHAVSVVLLWRVLVRLHVPGAWLGALLFGVHPLNVESVAWIAERKDVLATFFGLISVLAFFRESKAWRVFSVLAFLAAMLSKGSIALLPAVLAGILIGQRQPAQRSTSVAERGSVSGLDRGLWSTFRPLWPYWLIAAVLTAVNLWFQTHGTQVVIRPIGFLERALGAGAVVWFYVGKSLFPVHLSFVYPAWHIRPQNPLCWLPALAVVGLTAVLWRQRRTPAAAIAWPAWLYFLSMLVPVMGWTDVYFMRYAPVADHYAHLALIGIAAAAGAAWSRLPRGWAASVLAGVVVTALAALTWRQCGTFRDAPILWRSALARNPDAWLAHNNLGELLLPEHPEEAIGHFQAALRLDPASREPRDNLGKALARAGRLDAALAQFADAVHADPADAAAQVGWGNALMDAGQPEAAVAHFSAALRLQPELVPAQHDLAVAWERIGDAAVAGGHSAAAQEDFERALVLDPTRVRALNNLGNLLFQAGRIPEAIERYRAALRVDPGYGPAIKNLAAAEAAAAGR